MLSLNNIAIRRGGELLLESATLTINQGRRVGVIGANGAGKTTLFKLITGELESDSGLLDMPQRTRIAHLLQEVPATSERALDYVLGGDPELVRISSALAKAEVDGAFDRIGHLHDEFAAVDGYSARARGEKLLAGLGFSAEDANRTLAEFSGGWRIRLNLARTLMAPSDLLLLDEPTNHLDLDAIIWLADWIRRYEGTLLLISHDREFLDETVDQIAYLHDRRLELFSGNYSTFERIKAERLAEQHASYQKQQREIRHMQDFVRRFKAKASKARQAQSRIKALERMERIAPAHVDSPFEFRIPADEKTSSPLLKLDHASLGYDQTIVLDDVRLSLEPGDRIGLLGHNGAGKSTLVKTLRGELPLLAGERIGGANLRVGYFSQHQLDELNLDESALTHITHLDPTVGEQGIRNFLGGFDFRGDKVNEQVGTFSGGEKARLALAIVAHSKPNLLLMDEPTNHLDMEMRQALTVALQEFEGAIVLISHDRHLLSNTVDEFVLVNGGRIERYQGDLEDYRKRLNEPAAEESSARSADPTPPDPAAEGDYRYARQIRTRIKTIEQRLERLGSKLAEIDEALSDPEIYSGQAESANLQGLLREQLGLKEEITMLETEWIEKQDALERAG